MIFRYYLNLELVITNQVFVSNCFYHNHDDFIQIIKCTEFWAIFQVCIWYNNIDNVRYVMISVMSRRVSEVSM